MRIKRAIEEGLAVGKGREKFYKHIIISKIIN